VIFKDKSDYKSFLNICQALYPKFQFFFHSYCLMPNHYHFYIETPRANLSSFMRNLNSLYTQYFNRKYKRVGPLFQGRYKAILIDKEYYSLQLSRYIHLNPVKAGLVKNPEDYEWSSYALFLRQQDPKVFVKTKWLFSQVSTNAKDPREAFRQFTLDGLSDSWEPLKEAKGGSLLGREAFLDEIKNKWVPKKKDSSISRLKELQRPRDIEHIEAAISKLGHDPKLNKKLLVYLLKKFTPFSLKEIGEKIGSLSPSGLCQVVRRLEQAKSEDKRLRGLIKKLEISICQM